MSKATVSASTMNIQETSVQFSTAGRLQPGEEKKNKVSGSISFAIASLARSSKFPRILTIEQWSNILKWPGLAGLEDEDTVTPSYEYQDGEEKHLRERTYQLEERIDQQAKLISRLRSDIEKEVAKSIEIKQSADRMAYSMENKELSIGRQDSDEDIYTRFRSLIGQIKTWSVPFAHGHQEAGACSMETIEEFRKISPGVPDIRRFLRKPRNVRLLVRGYVGFVIAKSLCRQDVWMDKELAHSFASIENSLFHSSKDIHLFHYVAMISNLSSPEYHLRSGVTRLESSYSGADIET